MILDKSPYTFDRAFRLAVTILCLLCLVWLLSYLSGVLVPFAVAFLLAYLLNPVVNKVQKKVKRRWAAVLLTFLGMLLVFTIFCAVTVPVIIGETTRMGGMVKNLVENAELSDRIAGYIPAAALDEIKNLLAKDEMANLWKQEKFWAVLGAVSKKVFPELWSIFTGTVSFILSLAGLVVIGIYLVFLLLDFDRAQKEWRDLLPTAYRDSILGFLAEFDKAMSRHFRAQAVVAALTGVMLAVGFTLIGLPMGVLLGLFIGLLNMVPYLQIVGLVPAGLLAVMKAVESGSSVWASLGLLLLVFAVAQVIQDVILTPKIMGEATGLSPAMILLSISVWGKLLGFLGLVIALPMTCLLLAYYRRMLASAKEASESSPPKAGTA